MGNTAMSSLGSMLASGQVRVLQTDGKVLHFAQPVLAIQVMQENPGHLLVKYNPSSKSNGIIKGTRDETYSSLIYGSLKQMSLKHTASMLRVDEELNPRSTYYLLPIKARKEVAGGWSSLFGVLKTSGKVASSFELEHESDSSGSEKIFSMLRRSRSLPRSRDSFQQVALEQHQEEVQKQQQKVLSPSFSFPRRSGYLGNPLMEGMGKFRELPRLQQTFQHKRPRRVRRKSQNNGWKPILESISEVVDEFSDDESAEFHRNQSKCLRRVHSHRDQLRTIARLRPVAV